MPVILVINKTDAVKKEEILKAIEAYRKLLDFAEIVPASALKGDNTDTIIDVIYQYLPYGPQFFDEDTITDQPMRQIVAEPVSYTHLDVYKRQVGKRAKVKELVK